MRETDELKRVLSPRVSKLQSDQVCDFCLCSLPRGSESTSYGVVDRKYRSWERLYFCELHGDIIENINNEDLPEFHQEYLISSGFANEFYGR